MEKGAIGDKRKVIISIVVVALVIAALILCLIFFTSVFSSNENSPAEIRKIEKKLEEIQIPEIPEIEEIEEEEEVENNIQNAPGPPPPPSIPSMSDYDLIAHSVYPAFAKAYNLSTDNGLLVASDKIIYENIYYSINGSNWSITTLQGDNYEDYPWLLDYGRINLPSELGQEGTHYILLYSCSLRNNTWDCHGDVEDGVYVNKWQLRILENETFVINLSEIITPEVAYDVCNEYFCTTEEVWVQGNLSRVASSLGRFVLFDHNDASGNGIYMNINEEGVLSEELTTLHDEFKVHKDGIVEVNLKGTLEPSCEMPTNAGCTWIVNMDLDVESMEFIREVACEQEEFLVNNNLSSMACFNDSLRNLTRAYEVLINSTICTDDARTPSGGVYFGHLGNRWYFPMNSDSSSGGCTEYCSIYENRSVFERSCATGMGEDLLLEEPI